MYYVKLGIQYVYKIRYGRFIEQRHLSLHAGCREYESLIAHSLLNDILIAVDYCKCKVYFTFSTKLIN